MYRAPPGFGATLWERREAKQNREEEGPPAKKKLRTRGVHADSVFVERQAAEEAKAAASGEAKSEEAAKPPLVGLPNLLPAVRELPKALGKPVFIDDKRRLFFEAKRPLLDEGLQEILDEQTIDASKGDVFVFYRCVNRSADLSNQYLGEGTVLESAECGHGRMLVMACSPPIAPSKRGTGWAVLRPL